MQRSKLEYLTKNLQHKSKLDLIEKIDPNNDYDFDLLAEKFLREPDTKDPFILLAIPNYMDPTFVEKYKQKYVKKFEEINELCIKNKIKPFFKDPTNLRECELTREDLCEQVYESELNEYFNVKSFRDYDPPVYDPQNENNKKRLRFNFIKNDKRIHKLYNDIQEYEDREKGWGYHNFDHVSNVVRWVEQLLREFKYDDDFIEEAMIAGILHDTGCIEGKKDHQFRSYEFAKNYLQENNIKLKNEQMVLDAIKLHSDGFDTDNIMALVLILSDKLDIKFNRVTIEGAKVEGMRQMRFIKEAEIKIFDNTLKINYICADGIDLAELERYYFIPKVFKSIKTFGEKFNLTIELTMNNKLWDAYYLIK